MRTTQSFEVRNLQCLRQDRLLFSSLSFRLETGRALIVKGQNGCGKSSLLRILAGLMSHDNGNIFWNDQPIASQLSHYTASRHFIGHAIGLKLKLTIDENIKLLSAFHCRVIDESQLVTLLSELTLLSHRHTPLMQLSAGQKRRVSLIKLRLFPKTLWILDEPFTALDDATQILVTAYLKEHLHSGGMAVISSHHPIHLTNLTETLQLT